MAPRVPQGRCDVDAPHDAPADELSQLRDCVKALGSIISLPNPWKGGEPAEIVDAVLDALLQILRLDFAPARRHDPDDGQPLETVRVADSLQSTVETPAIRQILDSTSGVTCGVWRSGAQTTLRDVGMFVT